MANQESKINSAADAGSIFLNSMVNSARHTVRAELDPAGHAFFDLASATPPPDLAASAGQALTAYLHALRLDGGAPADETEFARLLDDDPAAWHTVLDTFPALAGLAAHRLRNWARACGELATRLHDDRAALTEWLGLDERLHPSAITLGLGDWHDGARSVAVITERGGQRFAYRPRPLDAMCAFQRFCADLGETEVRLPAMLPRPGYGWARWVQHRPCTDTRQRAEYARRLGQALAVLWALGGTDLHRENVVGQGAQPVIVDMETPLGIDPALAAGDAGAWAVGDSALGTGVLPGALPFPGAPETSVAAELLADAAPDERDTLHAGLIRGFRDAAHRIAERRDMLLGPDSALSHFDGRPLRVIVRPTYRYTELLGNADHPALLSTMDARQRHFEQLGLDAETPLPELVTAEIAQLHGGDVPLVEVPANGTQAYCGGAPVLELPRGPLDRTRARIAAMTTESADVEAELVADCLLTDRLNRGPEPPPAGLPAIAPSDELVEAALAAGLALRERARRSPAGVCWLDVASVAGRDWHLAPSDDSLYRGLPGIAVACAQLAERTGDARIAGLRDEVVDGWLRTPVPDGPGAFAGAAGQLLAATLIARCAPGLPVDARATEALAVLAAGRPGPADVHFGVAGAVLVLTSVGALDTGAWHACARSLADAAAGGASWWHGPAGRGLTGFAHGSAGIVLALDILAAQGIPGTSEPARRLRAWQDTQYVPAEGGWRDLRLTADGPVTTSWCNGTAGIGLALALRTHLGVEPPEDPERLRTAVTTSLRRGTGHARNACDGDLGVAGLLLNAGTMTGDDEWVRAGRRIAGTVAARVLDRRGAMTVTDRLDRRAGAMNGYAGVVLGLLHAADPSGVPSLPALGLNLVPPRAVSPGTTPSARRTTRPPARPAGRDRAAPAT